MKGGRGRVGRVAATAALAAAAVAPLVFPPHALAVAIRGIHASPGDGYTRVVIDLSAGTRYQYGYVPPGADKPARFYVDVHDVILSGKEDSVVPVADPRVSRVRTGQYKEKIARIVLELKGTVTPKILKVDDPPRIVVDLSGPGAPEAPPAVVAGAKGGGDAKTSPAALNDRGDGDKKAGPALNGDAAPRTGRAAAGAAATATQPGGSRPPSDAKVLGNVPAADPRVLGAAGARRDGGAPTPPTKAATSTGTPSPPMVAGKGTALQPILPGGQAATSGPPAWSQAPVPTGGSEALAGAAQVPGAVNAAGAPARTTGASGAGSGQLVTPAPPVVAGRGTELRALPPRAPAATPGSTAVAAAKKARPVRVVIDPGHGGKDPGAKGPGGTEKDSVLDISKRVAAKLRKDLGIEVHMTRSEDVYLPLDERKNLANRLEADLFVSIHANASRNTKAFGIETYYLKNTNDRATLRLARLENGVDMLIKGGDVSTDADLSYILSDIIQGQKEADSILLANHIQSALCGHLRKSYDSIKSLGVKQGPFLVLDGTYMPSVLVEAGFVSNSHEGGRLRASAYREAVAEGIYRGIKAYLEDDRVNDLT